MADPQPGIVHEDSISSQDPNAQDAGPKTKSRRPASEEFLDDLRMKRIPD
jgi:hypothetical protein